MSVMPAPFDYTPHRALYESSLIQDFEANEPTFPIIHAHGVTKMMAPPEKPYVYGQNRIQAEALRDRWNTMHPFDPML